MAKTSAAPKHDLETLDSALYPLECSRCGHRGEDHMTPSEGGACCVGYETPGACKCKGFKPWTNLKAIAAALVDAEERGCVEGRAEGLEYADRQAIARMGQAMESFFS